MLFFLQDVKVTVVTFRNAVQITALIVTKLGKLGLNLDHPKCQGNDGASNMSSTI